MQLSRWTIIFIWLSASVVIVGLITFWLAPPPEFVADPKNLRFAMEGGGVAAVNPIVANVILGTGLVVSTLGLLGILPGTKSRASRA